MTRACDILVAGAGPAGAMAAARLVRAGLTVVIADGHSALGPRPGEVLPGAAIRLLQKSGLGAVIEASRSQHLEVGGSLVAWNSGQFLASDGLRDPYGPGLRLDRSAFDAAMRQSAAGADLVTADVIAVDRRLDGWRVGLADGSVIACRFLVDATGRRSKIGRLLGVHRRRGAPLPAVYRTGVPAKSGQLDRTLIEAFADGWVYAGRMADGRFAIGIHGPAGESLALANDPALWLATLGKARAISDLLGSITLTGPAVLRDARSGVLDRVSGEGWVACGDAALSFDPIAGQGLFNALRSGLAAAEAILAAGSAKGFSDYNQEMHEVTRIYLQRRQGLYLGESRWPDSPFWQEQRLSGGVGSDQRPFYPPMPFGNTSSGSDNRVDSAVT